MGEKNVKAHVGHHVLMSKSLMQRIVLENANRGTDPKQDVVILSMAEQRHIVIGSRATVLWKTYEETMKGGARGLP
jgi:hypothetical protein